MGRQIHRLSKRKVEKIVRERGKKRHADGGGLYMRDGVWFFLYKSRTEKDAKGRPRPHELALGSDPDMSLDEARELAAEQRRLLASGKDPKAERIRLRKASEGVVTVREATRKWMEATAANRTSVKSTDQIRSTLLGERSNGKPAESVYLAGILDMPVGDVTIDDIVRVFAPLNGRVVAARMRSWLEGVFDRAHANGWTGDGTWSNPVKGASHRLPVAGKRTVEHLAALPWRELPALVRELQARDDIASKALLFTFMCAARTEETVGATWGEIDLQTCLWTIPAARMKAAKDHVVPLSEAALKVLRGLPRDSAGDFVFPGARSGEPLGPTIMLRRLQDMRPGVTVHGSVRSGFKDWASETDASDDIVVEMALAHAIPSAVERAYRRGRLLERRRQLMSRWATFLTGEAEAPNVVTLRDAQAR